MIRLGDKVRALVDGKNFAVLSTLEPDGALVEELSNRYTGGPYPGFAEPSPQWVIAQVTANTLTTSWPSP